MEQPLALSPQTGLGFGDIFLSIFVVLWQNGIKICPNQFEYLSLFLWIMISRVSMVTPWFLSVHFWFSPRNSELYPVTLEM